VTGPRGLTEALARAPGALEPWVGLLDGINVFPVADGDTGRNLVHSLAPLAPPKRDREEAKRALLLAARGNSGNIATQFFSAWLGLEAVQELVTAASAGRERARSAIGDPQPGTMLSLFDALEAWVARWIEEGRPLDEGGGWVPKLLDHLAGAVLETKEQQPSLSRAGVVDAGALGMFIVLEACLGSYAPRDAAWPTVAQRFGPYLRVRTSWSGEPVRGFCVDAVLRSSGERDELARLHALGKSVTTMLHDDLVKLHVHVDDMETLRAGLGSMGEVLQLDVDDMGAQAEAFDTARRLAKVHLMTDGAGTFPAEDAARLRVTVLDSYIHLGGASIPESKVVDQALYAAMRRGEAPSTAQAATAERHELYQKALEEGKPVLYLATGSAFTGNVGAAEAFRDAQGLGDRFVVVDSGAASGRLGLVARATAERIQAGADMEEAVSFVERVLGRAHELIFLSELRFLARGGRISRTAAFFGDTFRVKPIVSPQPAGVEKVGTVRRESDQLPFLWKYLGGLPAAARPAMLLLQYTDNEERLREEIAPALRERYPAATLWVRRLSLTTGVHVGPGSWALAWLPDPNLAQPRGSARSS